MTRTCRGLTVALAAAAIFLTGCTGDDDDGAEQTPTSDSAPSASTGPSTPEATDYAYRIPAKVRNAFFDDPIPAEFRRWVPRQSLGDGRTAIRQRRLPGCDSRPWLRLKVDQAVRDFAFAIRDTETGFVVARQLTVYDDEDAAKQVVPQLNRRAIGCVHYAGRDVYATQVSDLGPDRFFGITANHDRTLFGEGYNATQGRSANWVEVVTRENNAVVLTRIADLAYEGNPDVIGRKAQQQPFVVEVRRQGTISARTLNAFR